MATWPEWPNAGVMLCEIHFRSRSANAEWLHDTMKLIVSQEISWLVVRCLSLLALYLPDALTEDQARWFVPGLREALGLLNEPINEGISYKAPLRELLLAALVEAGPAAGVARKTSSQMGKALGRGRHTAIPQMERVSKLAVGSDPRLHCAMIVQVGWFHSQSGQIKEALDCANRAKEIAERIGDEKARKAAVTSINIHSSCYKKGATRPKGNQAIDRCNCWFLSD